jgi:hypothetical protein
VLASKNASASISPISSSPPHSSPSTCPSGTVNYITHSLPQQCLTTSWGGQVTPAASSAASSSTLTNSFGTDSPRAPTPSEALPLDAEALTIPASQDLSNDASEPASSVIPSVGTTAPQPTHGGHAALPTQPEQEIDQDSPLDNAKFLSFEDWKRQALAKAEQSAEKMDSVRAGGSEPRRRPGNINNALDSLGEDSEIELDFPGFVPESAEPTAWGRQVADSAKGSESKDEPNAGGGALPSTKRRSKDAGKTCKERFNYASFDCAANVLKHNPECSGSSSVLVENKDSYMLNECSAKNKFFIVELCNDILVDTIVLANFEFFSSIFRTFRVSVSDRYPVKLEKWQDLGTYEARNTREVQAFLIENPLIWARYLRIEFLTHYGNEYYCPVSLLRVHGTTPYEELKHEGESSRVEDELDQEAAESAENGEKLEPEVVPEPIVEEAKTALQKMANASDNEQHVSSSTPADSASITASGIAAPEPNESDNTVCATYDPLQELRLLMQAYNITIEMCDPSESPLPKTEPYQPVSPPAKSKTPVADEYPQSSPASPVKSPSSSKRLSSTSSSSIAATQDSSIASSKTVKTSSSSSSSSQRSTSQTGGDSIKTASSLTQPPPANPTTQESFLKSIHKRLQMLETNSTLSLLYIEEQSRILRDAFSKVEKRQLSKTTTFLENLNVTVLSELRDFRQQYDQIWQSTVIELENQRESYRREVVAITARLSVLADEVIFQKRMSIVQSILILICLALVLTKGSTGTYLELPLMQNMLTRSQSSFFRSSSPAGTYETPTSSPTSTRPNSSYMEKRSLGFFRRHKRGVSDDSQNDTLSPRIQYSPPTPTSETGPSDLTDDDNLDRSRSPSPGLAVNPTFRPMSSPPTLGAPPLNAESTTTTWLESNSLVSRVLTPSENPETPPGHPSMDKLERLNGSVKIIQTPPDT